MENKNELVNLSIRCEHIIRSKFSSLKDNRYSEIKMFTFGGIVYADSIRTKGGLYLALVSTLSRFYEEKDMMLKIDDFLDKYCDIEGKELEELEHDFVEQILKDFQNLFI